MKTIAFRASGVFLGLGLVLSACAPAQVEEPPQPPPAEVVEEEQEEALVDVPRHPLTGVELGGLSVEGPSIAIKIDNTGAGRPQVGIAAADIVFEELVEGGVTRYLAVYHTEIPDEVGPVRSGRPQDADLVASLGGVFVFSGVGNSNVREIIRATGLTLVEHDTSSGTPNGKYFFRSSRKPAPLNLHIEASALIENYQTLPSPVQQFEYRTDPAQASAVVAGEAVESLTVVFSRAIESIWKWDEQAGVYLKFLSNGSPDSDANGTQIRATNVIVLTPNYFDVESLPSARISGTEEAAFVFTGGKMVAGSFDATEVGSPMRLLFGEGETIFLSPGKTFILLAPGAGSQAQGVSVGFMTLVRGGASETIGF